MKPQEKNCNVMFIIASVLGFLTIAFNIIDLIYNFDKYEKAVRVLLIVSLVFIFITSVWFLFIALLKTKEKQFKYIQVTRTMCVLAIFGSLLGIVFAWIGFNRLNTAYINSQFNNPNESDYQQPNSYFAKDNQYSNKVKDDVIDVEAEVISEETEKTYDSLQDEIAVLQKKLDEGKISEEEFYQRKNEILRKYY